MAQWFEENARLAQESVDRFCELSDQLREAGIGHQDDTQEPQTRDAWAFMAVRVDWEGGDHPPGLLHLAEPLRQRIRSYGSEWPQAIQPSDYSGLDFSWMTELQQFDHWNVLREVPALDPSVTGFDDVPIPNFFALQNWVKLRFARAFATGDFLSASADVRHLAKLLRTTGLVIGDMVALKLLDLEREAHAAAREEGIQVPGWSAYSSEVLDAYRRVARAADHFTLPGVSPLVSNQALRCTALSRCTALYSGIGVQAGMGHLVGSTQELELGAIGRAVGCNQDLMRWLDRTAPVPEAEALGITSQMGTPEDFLGPSSDGPR